MKYKLLINAAADKMPRANRSYTLKEEEELCEAFRQYPVIYDKTNEDHKNNNVITENAWKAIVEQLDFLDGE